MRVSIVIPTLNEAGNIGRLVTETYTVVPAEMLGEIIVVDDGSTDATADEIAALIAGGTMPALRYLRHGERSGQSAAMRTGILAASHHVIATMDGDGQNDPRDFPLLLAPVEAGTLDVACGWRHDRHDSWLRRRMSRLANFVRGRVLGDQLHDSGCQLRVMRREVVAALFPFELLQSFLPAILVAAGFRLGEFRVRHHPRLRGEAKYGLRQLWLRPALAMFRLHRRLRR